MSRSVPVPLAIVRLTPLLSVICPPPSTTVWSTDTAAVTVTVCPVRIMIAPLAEVGVAAGGTHVLLLSTCHVPTAFQLPLPAER